MYLLTTVSITQNKSQTFVQLRDEHMRLIAFFHPARLETILENEQLSKHNTQIINTLQHATPGRLYHINTRSI
jgi:hypothetical protein